MVAERRVLRRVQHLEQGRGRVAPVGAAHLVDLVQQEEGVGRLGLLHRLDDLARHGADIGPAVTADLGLVAHAAQGDAHELTAGRLGDRLAQRGLADAGRTHQAEDRALQRADPRLHGEVLQDPLLDLLQAEVVAVQDFLGLHQVDGLGLGLAPRDREQPVEVVPHDGGFRRHRAHVAKLLQLALGLGAGFLGELGLLDALLELDQFVALIVLLAQLALDRLHLLVEIVLALGLLHLPLHAVPDLLLGLHDRDLTLHEGVDLLQALHDVEDLEQALLLGDLHRQMTGDAVGELTGRVDLRHRGQRLRRHLLVQFDVVLELLDDRARQRLGLGRGRAVFGNEGDLGFVELFLRGETGNTGARLAFDQHLHGAVRKLQQLQNRRHDPDVIDGLGRRIIVVLVLLGREEDLLAFAPHRLFERAYGFLPAHEERHRLMRKHDDVPQR